MGDRDLFMRVRKYIQDRHYGFLSDNSGREAFFHASVFDGGAKEDSPPPVAGEEVLVDVDLDGTKEGVAARATRVRRLEEPKLLNGRVSSFNPERGFGFVEGEDGVTYYLHRSEVMGGRLPLSGLKVTFRVSEQKHRARACYVEVQIGASTDDE